MKPSKSCHLLAMLISLTVIFVTLQILLFVRHYKVTDIIDSMVNTSISSQLLNPMVLMPTFIFILIQLLAYCVFVIWLWFLSHSLREYFALTNRAAYLIGILCWGLACIVMLGLNHYYFPHSFFASYLGHSALLKNIHFVVFSAASVFLFGATIFTLFTSRHDGFSGRLVMLIGLIFFGAFLYDNLPPSVVRSNHNNKPNIIIIGLDSVRPDFTGYFGNTSAQTPNIDAFLKTASTFTHAYTPLARTFPAWVSILTAKYPLHNGVRANLGYSNDDMLSKRLQQAGYTTIYATDEKRFSNITEEYGFDRVVGPSMGVNDFLLGSFSDFPLTNLLVGSSLGRFLFPYNYGNRAAAITYRPAQFLKLVQLGLRDRPNKPLFLAIHLCLSHWPFVWASDPYQGLSLSKQYQHSIEAVDHQLGQVLSLLKKNGLLENSVMVLLSDHGTGVGLPGDRLVRNDTYQGNLKQLHLISKLKFSTAPQFSKNKNDYSINTSYGQGTDILSLKQYQVILAFKHAQGAVPAKNIETLGALIDIAPTVLDLVKLPSIPSADGVSLRSNFFDPLPSLSRRAFFVETGDSLTEIETDHIYIEKVIKHQIGIYRMNPNGLLRMDNTALGSVIKNKQRVVLWGDWLLARYPANIKNKTILSPYYVIANMKTGQWTIGLDSPFARTAPTEEMLLKLKAFYGNELN